MRRICLSARAPRELLILQRRRVSDLRYGWGASVNSVRYRRYITVVFIPMIRGPYIAITSPMRMF